MNEWLTLLLLVPAIVVPVVLLFGFAGCSFCVCGNPAPSIIDAVGNSINSITLTWTYPVHDPDSDCDCPDPEKFELERRAVNQAPELFEVFFSPLQLDDQGFNSFKFDDQGLLPATSYLYRMRAVFADHPRRESEWASTVLGKTLSPPTLFQTAFEWTTDERTVARNSGAWQGFSLLQRIEPNRLLRSGTKVRLTLRAASKDNASPDEVAASIERIYISQADPAGDDPFDSASDLTIVTDAHFVLPYSTAWVSPTVDYNLDMAQPLLVVVDFSGVPPNAVPSSEIRITAQTPREQALGYFKEAPDGEIPNEAPKSVRTGFTEWPGISLIEKIEVG